MHTRAWLVVALLASALDRDGGAVDARGMDPCVTKCQDIPDIIAEDARARPFRGRCSRRDRELHGAGDHLGGVPLRPCDRGEAPRGHLGRCGEGSPQGG